MSDRGKRKRSKRPRARKGDSAMRRILRRAKAVGISREEALCIAVDGANKAATEQGWGEAERAMTIASYQCDVEAVYGPEKAPDNPPATP